MIARGVLLALVVVAADPYFGNGCRDDGCAGCGRSADHGSFEVRYETPDCGRAVTVYLTIFDDPPKLTPEARRLAEPRLNGACRADWAPLLLRCIVDSKTRAQLDACWKDPAERDRVARIAANTDTD